uniref:Uncharacterized protein n=1 Tax=Hyaloperonospora arabidopsidis (strain Emoy2) TaxID=559515 RepID=M4BYS0_HYAAE
MPARWTVNWQGGVALSKRASCSASGICFAKSEGRLYYRWQSTWTTKQRWKSWQSRHHRLRRSKSTYEINLSATTPGMVWS